MSTQFTSSSTIRLVSIALTASFASIRELLTAAGVTLPEGAILQVIVNVGSATVSVKDGYNEDDAALPNGEAKIYPVRDCLDSLYFKDSAAGSHLFEFYIEEK